ncbi:cytidyltransferase [Halobacillus sp. K22]|uniref:cytidyltransferase n=1 Tax=Halobacillus sp. K22 TaxID=3457431 RepID=UPI003FCE7C6E
MITIPIKHPIAPSIQENSQSCVLALGFFDGVHLGHQKIISTAKKIAKDKGLKLAAMTFAQHPSSVIPKGPTITRFITPLSAKVKIFEQLGVDILYVVDFTKELAQVPHQEFVDQYLCGLNSKHVVAGFDYKYGFKGKGDMNQLSVDSKDRFGVTTVSKFEKHEQKVSSTLLRTLISTGRVEEIPHYLGKSYEMAGKAEGKGKTCTFSFDPTYFMPIPGHYEVTVKSNLFQAKGMCEVPLLHCPGELTTTFFEETLHGDLENAALQWNNFIADFEMDILHAQGDLRELEMSM